MNLKRFAALILAAVMSVTMLASCGQIEDTPLENPNTGTVAPIVTDAPVTTTETPTLPPITTAAPPTTAATTEATTAATTEATTAATKKTDKNDFTVEEMTPTTMYATMSLNVRKGPSTDFGKLGALAEGDAVTVVGRASTGWYKIQFKDSEGYVSNVYMTADAPSSTPAKKPSANKGDDDDTEIIGDDDTEVIEPSGTGTTPSNPSSAGTVGGDWIADNYATTMYNALTSDDYRRAMDLIGEAVQNLWPRVNLGAYLDESEVMDFAEYLSYMPSTTYCYFDRASEISGTTVYLKYYVDNAADAEKMVSNLKSRGDKVMSAISGYSDYNKIRYIYEWVAKNSVYEHSNHFASSYGPIVDGNGTCVGYAKAAFYLLSRAGFDCIYCYGVGMEEKHAWVKIKYNGKWYNLDQGWADDTKYEQSDRDFVCYDFMLMSDSFTKNSRTSVKDLSKYLNVPAANTDENNWYYTNGYVAGSISEAKKILKAEAKDVLSRDNGAKRIYVRIQFTTMDLFNQAIDEITSSVFNKEILDGVSTSYKCVDRHRNSKKNTRAISFILEK